MSATEDEEAPGTEPAVEQAEQDAEAAEEAEQGATPELEPIEGEGDDDAPPVVPASQVVTPEQHDVRVAKLGKSFATYTRRMEELFEGDSDDYFQCPLCMGETPGFLNRGALGRFPDDQADLVKQVLGIARPVDYPASSQHRTCPECQGLGKVTTGSRVPGKETIGCGACNERGYIGPAVTPTLEGANGDAGLTGPTVYGEAPETGDKDEWDQPKILPDGRDNPNYGRGPKYWIKVDPWGDTRGLTARDAVPAGGR